LTRTIKTPFYRLRANGVNTFAHLELVEGSSNTNPVCPEPVEGFSNKAFTSCR